MAEASRAYDRKRDPRFQKADCFKPKEKRTKEQEDNRRFTPKDFVVAEDLSHAICPAGKRLYRNGGNCHSTAIRRSSSTVPSAIAKAATITSASKCLAERCIFVPP